MKLFSFDKFWKLDWIKNKQSLFTCERNGFIYAADTTRANAPVFSIYKSKVDDEHLLMTDLDTDLFIMQMKSIGEHGKLLIHSTKK